MLGIPDAVILSGGFGLRLRGVIGETPKPMAPVGGRPFMELLFKQLKRHGFSRVVLSVGYKHEMIREYFGDKACGLQLVYSIETSPLGTGGALRQAVDFINTDNIVIMNGDSYTDADLGGLVRKHAASDAAVTVVVIPETRNDAGSVVMDSDGKVINFAEKRPIAGSRYLSAGIYELNRELISALPPAAKISLETELFPQWLAEGKSIQTLVYNGRCIDIGTPERYQMAQDALRDVELQNTLNSEGQS
jgi:D-glycero-alpha-D-manno-heptose 1-phosphate guanylyltransferase